MSTYTFRFVTVNNRIIEHSFFAVSLTLAKAYATTFGIEHGAKLQEEVKPT